MPKLTKEEKNKYPSVVIKDFEEKILYSTNGTKKVGGRSPEKITLLHEESEVEDRLIIEDSNGETIGEVKIPKGLIIIIEHKPEE